MEPHLLACTVPLSKRKGPNTDCATHFQALLKKYPPQVRRSVVLSSYARKLKQSRAASQTSSRTSAGLHLCMLHNLVNERLGKDEYDCSQLDYDCGCGPEESSSENTRPVVDSLTGEELVGG